MAYRKKKTINWFKLIRTNQILDSLVFYSTRKKWVLETIRFKYYLLKKKKQHISKITPLIIGGCPRSGTTLLRSLLGMHPFIQSPQQEYNILIFNDDKEFIQDVFDFTDNDLSLFSSISDHIRFSEKIIEQYREKSKATYIAVKHPHHIAIIDDIFHYFPQAKFLHIIRDGRDVSCSLRTHPKRIMKDGKIIPVNTRNPFRWCVHRWISSINQGKQWRDSSNYIEVTYEDLVFHPLQTMETIFDFIGIEPIAEKQLLNFYKHERDDEHVQNIEVGTKLYRKSIGRWKHDMSLKEQQLFKKMAGSYLIELGYEDDLYW